jgi:ABC transport system ATP-binding/permease protein
MSAPKPDSSTPADARRKSPSGAPWWRRLAWWRKSASPAEAVATANSILPVLIEVFAGFSKLDGDVAEEEIDSSLNYLRYDYPDAIYPELRRLYFEALQLPQDLSTRAKELSRTLGNEQKLLLAIQLYLLISQTSPPMVPHGKKQTNRRQMVEFYLFTTNLGIASQAIDIVYQLAAEDQRSPEEAAMRSSTPVMEVLLVGATAPSDVLLRSLSHECTVAAYRFQNLVLLKNTGSVPVLVRSRRLVPGDFSRLYPKERVVLEDVTLDYEDLVSYFNAKKTLSGTQLYLTLTDDGDAEISPQRTRSAQLRLSFGLGVTVEALRDTKAFVNHVELLTGTKVDVSIEDSITLDKGEVEIALLDLQRRAREFGGQFRLEGSRTTYLVSNNPDLLDDGDILLSADTDGELQLRIDCDYGEKTGMLEVVKSTRTISVRGVVVRDKDKILLEDGDIITLGEGQFLRCHFSDRIIEEERNVIRHIEVRELFHRFDTRETAMDGISLSAKRGEMVCVMGPSGCGKSTFLRTLGGQLRPKSGEVLMNGVSLYEQLDELKPYVSYIPQEDAFDPLLRVQENLDCSVAIRYPHLRVEDRRRRVEAKLSELGLAEMRRRLAGTPQQKNLSGGERKRLNAGLDMIGISDLYLFDEPTSGLSSKDSEHVLGIIRSLASNKIVFASIHQPSKRLLDMFDKALLLDKGGKVAFFGTPDQMLRYFWRVYNEETGKVGAELEELPANVTPDFVFDVLETPLKDVSGDLIIEQNAEGHSVFARRFPPNFWRDRYQTYRLLQSVSQATGGVPGGLAPDTKTATGIYPRLSADAEQALRAPAKVPEPPRLKAREEFILFTTQLKRAFLSKLRNEGNVLTTLLEAPTLALLISLVLRYSEEDTYSFASAFHVPTYVFLTLVVAMFLGLTNSADEVIRDRAMLNRERNHNLRPGYYIAGKLLSLGTFALLQCIIYLLIGNYVLELRDMFGIHLWWMFLTAFTGSCLGMLVSSLVSDVRTALNIIPLLLIPQIILGGALIKYEEMNRNLDFVYSIQRYIKPEDKASSDYSTLKVPTICEFMPLRWSYEAALISQDKLNPLTRSQDVLDERIQSIIDKAPDGELDPIQKVNLDLSKQALAVVSGLRARDDSDLAKRLRLVVTKATSGGLTADILEAVQMEKQGWSAEDIYVNQKVHDLITKAEMEREDYRRVKSPNVFFGTKKRLKLPGYDKENGWGIAEREISTLWINAVVLLGIICLVISVLYHQLRRQLSRL